LQFLDAAGLAAAGLLLLLPAGVQIAWQNNVSRDGCEQQPVTAHAVC